MDRFLVNEGDFHTPPYIKKWVGEEGELDHFPIFLKVKVDQEKLSSPFKFNVTWLEDEGRI